MQDAPCVSTSPFSWWFERSSPFLFLQARITLGVQCESGCGTKCRQGSTDPGECVSPHVSVVVLPVSNSSYLHPVPHSERLFMLVSYS